MNFKASTFLLLVLAVFGPSFPGVVAEEPLAFKAAGFKQVEAAIADFLEIIGGENNENDAGPIDGGFRQINWDAGIVPFDMPGNFFRDEVTRGILLKAKGDEFRVSNPAKTDPDFPDDLFDSINPLYPKEFQAFSPERIFSPLKDNVLTCEFSIPGSPAYDEAWIAAFGAVFVDVDNKDETSIEYFNPEGKSLGVFYVTPDPQGVSFLGVYFPDDVVAKVVVKLGNAVLGLDDVPPKQEVVVMDDFFFSEPVDLKKPLPPGKPSSKDKPSPGIVVSTKPVPPKKSPAPEYPSSDR